MVRLAIYVRPGIDQEGGLASGRKRDGDGRPIDRLEAAERKKRAGHNGPGIPRADEGTYFSVPKEFHADSNRGRSLLSKGMRWGFIHPNNFGGVDNLNFPRGWAVLPEFIPQNLFRADQNHLESFLERGERGADAYTGRVIPSHRIEADLHAIPSMAKRPPLPSSSSKQRAPCRFRTKDIRSEAASAHGIWGSARALEEPLGNANGFCLFLRGSVCTLVVP
jgi:hypothetical protein